MVLKNLVFVFITLMTICGHQGFSQGIRLIEDPAAPNYGALEIQYQLILDSLQIKEVNSASFQVYTQSMTEYSQPAMLGALRRQKGLWFWVPRFPFEIDQGYKAELKLDAVKISYPFRPAGPAATPAPTVVATTPADSIVPANLLRFYIHFSQPMSKFQAYDYVHLLDKQGDTLQHVFYPADPPLWDAQGQRLTLLLDPGRIKTGLQPNLAWGPGLNPQNEYQLVVNEMPDFRGTPMSDPYRFHFKTGLVDRQQPDYRQWHFKLPPAHSSAPLVIELDESLNSAQAESHIEVWKDNQPWPVAIEVKPQQIVFISNKSWPPGFYQLRVHNTLEDWAGNSLRKLFEVQDPLEEIPTARWIEIPFQIHPKKP